MEFQGLKRMQVSAVVAKGCQQSLSTAERMLNLDQNDGLRRLRQFLNAYLSNRKLVAGSLLLLALFIYFWPSRLKLHFSSHVADSSYFCLNDQLRQWAEQERRFDVVIQHIPQRKEWEKPYVPFVGNGHLGIGLTDGKEELRVKGRRALSLPIGFFPINSLSLKDYTPSEAVLTDYRKGSVTVIQSYHIDSECVNILSTVYAHRQRTKLLMQDGRSLEIKASRSEHRWKETRKINLGGEQVEVSSRAVKTADGEKEVGVTIVSEAPVTQSTLTVKPGGAQKFVFRTIVQASEPLPKGSFSEHLKDAETAATKSFTETQSLTPELLVTEHNLTWRKLWSTNFGISFSRAPDTLNGDRINATLYAVLSNVPAPLHEKETGSDSIAVAEFMKQNEMCYNSHNTLLYPSKLWTDLRTVDELVDVANRWRLTLEKRGCVNLLKAGADGMAQAMVLSFGALKYTHHHLELHADPKELHRDYHFHGVLFGGANASVLDIWVEVGVDNKAALFVAVHSSVSTPFFACDAACLDPLVKLGKDRVQFPVKLTEPITPILYVASDREHLEEVKDSVHVKEIGEAPAHEHHILAMHKHGHRLGGLPTLFWVCLALLIITFHLFLFKLIFTEYCRDEKSNFSRGRYSV